MYTQIGYAQEELEVHLTTKDPIASIYLSKIFPESSFFDENYLSQIREVLEFDLNNTGYTEVEKRQNSKEIMLSYSNLATSFDKELWKKLFIKRSG